MKRLLIVEDDPDIAWLFRMILEPGFAVAVAPDLATARAALAAGRPDAILLDLTLPDGSGLDLCREVKAADPTLPVVVVTANRAAGRDAAECGADCFLPKPVEPDDVESAIGRLVAA
jgi:DNA-binding response OmpR family regulator